MNNHIKHLPNGDFEAQPLATVGQWMDEDKGYELGTQEGYEEFVKKRNCPWDEWKPSKDIV
jgi:hypothetical protein